MILISRSLTARALTLTVLVTLALPSASRAQGRFRTGSFTWTPVVSLRDTGIDTNVYDERDNPKEDTVAVMSPAVNGLLDLSRFTMGVSGQADFVYFERYASERSVNTRGSVRVDVPLSRVRPFASASFLDTRERQNAEIDLRARRTEVGFDGGLRLQTAGRLAFEVGARQFDLEYREGDVFRGVELAQRLNRRSTGAQARIRYDVSPLTQFFVEGDLARDRFDFSTAQDTDNLRINSGVEFAPDAIIRGRAAFGFHRMDPVGGEALGFEGFTSAVDLGYVLLGRTRFNGRFFRGATYSFDAQPYYEQTAYGLDVQHNLFGPIDLIAGAHRDLLDYPGIADRALVAHEDRVSRYGGGIGIRPTDRFNITFNYEYSERLSDLASERGFDRRRLYTTVIYGF